MNHTALYVTADDLHQLVSRLSEAGVDASERTPVQLVFISDPDGHRLEMSPHTASERARRSAKGPVPPR